MQLYTVRLKQKQMVTSFDSKGAVSSREEKEIDVTIRDMPWVTANMYKTTDANGTCTIEKQAFITQSGRGATKQHWSAARQSQGPAKSKPAVSPATASAAHAARTGNLAAAINGGS